ncbi:bZIP transcription factor atfA [Aspergillus lucknowensis]|uniref:Aft1 HRA domain-containing protein n=1 Tax=Aspergillus lucknowensis TaxID=176173 RepID=A0ABR4LMJ0_9EURO
MSAAVAAAITTNLPTNTSAHNSPMDTKRPGIKMDDTQDTKSQKQKGDSSSLAPPPRPNPTGETDTPDYFNSVHNPFSLEPNPFEQSFGGSGETPGKSILPPVASITSPALPGTSSAGGAYNWSNSLRSGPLSPAMLAGPAGGSDYFDSIGRGFPTPNESSLRTGLTPGGGGSMFPAGSPNSQALLQQLQNGGATPSTIEFHRTALNVAKKNGAPPTSNPSAEPDQGSQNVTATMDIKTTQPATVDPFGHHDATDAANGLFMLAKGGQPNANQFAAVPNPSALPPQTLQTNELVHDPSTSRRQSVNVDGVTTAREASGEASDIQTEQAKPAARGRGKRNTSTKATNTAGTRRKAEDSAQGSNKRTKHNNGSATTESPSEGESADEEQQPAQKKKQGDSKKMTDEEKRKNFLERNRVAALKCRQRKKQWLANLQAKVELFTSENDALTTTVTQLREEIVNLKTLLLAHKDCPVSQAQGLIWNAPYT